MLNKQYIKTGLILSSTCMCLGTKTIYYADLYGNQHQNLATIFTSLGYGK